MYSLSCFVSASHCASSSPTIFPSSAFLSSRVAFPSVSSLEISARLAPDAAAASLPLPASPSFLFCISMSSPDSSSLPLTASAFLLSAGALTSASSLSFVARSAAMSSAALDAPSNAAVTLSSSDD